MAAHKCCKSEPWLLTTSLLNAEQLYILQHSVPLNLSAMPCHPGGSITTNLQQLARNNAAATCVQIAKTTSQRRDGIIEPFQHLMRQLPNYDYAITPNYVASTLNYAAVTPKYAASEPKKNKHF